MKCRKCGADMNFVTLFNTQAPVVFVLCQCTECKMIDAVSPKHWYAKGASK